MSSNYSTDNDDDAFFDLHKKVTTDSAFANRMHELLTYIAKADKLKRPKERDKAIAQLLRECRYNPSFLVPLYFPKFSSNKPMTLWSRPHAIAMMSIAPNASITIQSSRQIGKCLTGDTKMKCRIGDDRPREITLKELFENSE